MAAAECFVLCFVSVVVIVCHGSCEEEAVGGQCDASWCQFDGRCYFFSDQSAKWIDARQACINLGANLVTIKSQDQQDFIESIVSSLPDFTYWLGLSDRETEGTWVGVDNDKLAYKNWSHDQPDNLNDEDCGMLYGDSGGWNDALCKSSLLYICQKYFNESVGCDMGWRTSLDQCYFFSDQDANWTDAKTKCSGRGANLATIKSQDEQDFMNSIVNHVHGYWFGLNDRETEGTWMWANKDKLPYDNWDLNQPYDDDGSQDCAMIFAKSGLWHDKPCDSTSYYICQKYTNEAPTTTPTTTAPTAKAPDISAPTTKALTTTATTTEAPTTTTTTTAPTAEAPDISALTAEAPDISAPTAEAPDSSAPTAEAPDISAPTAEAPDSSAPTAEAPDISAPTAEAPDISAPTAEAPDISAPTTKALTITATTPEAPTTTVSSTIISPTTEAPTTTMQTTAQTTPTTVTLTPAASSSPSLRCTDATGPEIPDNMTLDQFKTQLVQQITDELTLNALTLSSSRAKKTSAPDSRLSSQMAGGVAIGIIVSIGLLMLSSDLVNLVRYRRKGASPKKSPEVGPSMKEARA